MAASASAGMGGATTSSAGLGETTASSSMAGSASTGMGGTAASFFAVSASKRTMADSDFAVVEKTTTASSMAMSASAGMGGTMTTASTASGILGDMAGYHCRMGKLVTPLPKFRPMVLQVSGPAHTHPCFPVPGNDQNYKSGNRR